MLIEIEVFQRMGPEIIQHLENKEMEGEMRKRTSKREREKASSEIEETPKNSW